MGHEEQIPVAGELNSVAGEWLGELRLIGPCDSGGVWSAMPAGRDDETFPVRCACVVLYLFERGVYSSRSAWATSGWVRLDL